MHKLIHQFSLRMARLHCEEHSNRDSSRLSLALKNMRSGDQEEVTFDELVEKFSK